MIIYNITYQPDPAISEEWLDWMLTEEIPSIMQTGCFERYQVAKLLETGESEGPTYSFQFYTSGKTAYDHYLAVYAPSLRENSLARWGDQVISFRSVMESVH